MLNGSTWFHCFALKKFSCTSSVTHINIILVVLQKKKKNTTIIHNAFQFVSLDINMLCTSYKSIYSTIYTVAVQSIYNHYVNKHMNTIFFSRKKEG